MSEQKINEIQYRKPSIHRKIVALLLIFALAGSAFVSAVALFIN
ncbi:hypothetical protein [Arcanobacterium hippocoleae]|uniref:DUF4044 domain-containing protein n=1 Tax=Arcanobacterium hippocoleae TaxID=149017 RepID=A0ABU1T1E6_9ACTO|nr:hypothetical protein [Arcanobacterium hippocoleae]MDR6939190.1 hypothetical protein [Arcanobacterium hippocoleae]